MEVELGTEEANMDTQLEILAAQALKLTASERAAFAQLLLASLDEDADIDQAWALEVEHRIGEIERGESRAIPIKDALAQVRATLK
jgi:putative addiction module component (TIGR02574 family)